jgi:hypothetical protein
LCISRWILAFRSDIGYAIFLGEIIRFAEGPWQRS